MTAAGPLRDRTVVVTGGSMGIGRACAAAVLAAGGRVVIAARGAADLARAGDALAHAAAGRVLTVQCDVAKAADVSALFDAAVERFGAVHGVVHAAAVIGSIGPILEIDPEDWLATLRVNLFGSFLVLRAAAGRMRLTGGGRIVLLSGGGATGPFPNYTAYACSKAGVVRLVETAAQELAEDGIAVNALAPGFVATRMHDATLEAGARAGPAYLERTRAELAAGGVAPSLAGEAAVFLLSEASTGISGRLYAAPWDDASEWTRHAADIAGSDLFTLRRIVPRDRGATWQ